MNTSALESKITAFKLLQQISENMGKSFGPFCEAILPVVLDNMGYQFSKAVRKFALKTAVNMIAALNEPVSVAVFQNALYPALVKLITASVEGKDLKGQKTLLKHLWLMLKALNESKSQTAYLTEAHFNVLGPLLGKVLTQVREAKTIATKQINGVKKNFELDEEDMEKVKEELAKQCEASTYVMEISG
jgi:hypothetical protein